jgi:hypothetical protein
VFVRRNEVQHLEDHKLFSSEWESGGKFGQHNHGACCSWRYVTAYTGYTHKYRAAGRASIMFGFFWPQCLPKMLWKTKYFFFCLAEHKINVKALEDHQSPEVGIDSFGTSWAVCGTNKWRGEQKDYFRRTVQERAILKSCRRRMRNRGNCRSLYIIAKYLRAKSFLWWQQG